MRLWVTGATLLLLACSPEPTREPGADEVPIPSGPPAPQQLPEEPAPVVQSAYRWETVVGGQGTAIRLVDAGGKMLMSIGCLEAPARLVVSVPAFDPVGSEDRFALGLGPEPVTLVADPTRQAGRPGVTAEGPVVDDLEGRLARSAQVTALYGSQQAGPFPPPPEALAGSLGEACEQMK